jgi:tRNA threonylcarbamoyladenosine modification (KEOPS) complex  Pcc1 subunit
VEAELMKAKATVCIPFQSKKALSALVKAITPEVESKTGTRSKAELIIDKQTLLLKVEAEDTVALRSTLNAFLRWISSTIRVFETVEKI